MRRKTFWIRSVWIRLVLLFISEVIVTGYASAQGTEHLQSQELAFSLGGISGQTRTLRGSPAGIAQIAADRTLGINYAHHLAGTRVVALYGEIEFVAVPNRGVTSATAVVAQNYASLYVYAGSPIEVVSASAVFSLGGRLAAGTPSMRNRTSFPTAKNTTNRFLNRGASITAEAWITGYFGSLACGARCAISCRETPTSTPGQFRAPSTTSWQAEESFCISDVSL